MRKITFLFVAVLFVSTAFAQKGYKNPAAAYCELLGYRYSIITDKQGNDIGICILPNGQEVNAWDFYKGKVAKEYSYAAKKGYKIETVVEKVDGFTTEKAACTRDVKGVQERLSLEELMEKNGDKMQLENRGSSKDIYEIAKEDPSFKISKSIPTSFDWRNYNGHSYIGAIRAEGSCTPGYAFSASACAEGTYNFATGHYDSNTANFSESYIAWCLGAMPAYTSHFYGCNYTDYTYSELQALVDIGTINESYFPYSAALNQSCPSATSTAPKIKFDSWYRVPCSDINAIKTAIMTYGVVDAAVFVTSNFDNYSGGIFSDTSTHCSSCYNTPTNHGVALVGWGNDPTYGEYWILRNSRGTSWGEGGYMRIKATSARVACAVSYLVYAPLSINGSITDLCNGASRTFSTTYYANATYQWTAGPGLSLSNSTSSTVTVTANASFNGFVTLSLSRTMTSSGGVPVTRTTSIKFWIGKPSIALKQTPISDPQSSLTVTAIITPVTAVGSINEYQWDIIKTFDETWSETTQVPMLNLDEYVFKVTLNAECQCGNVSKSIHILLIDNGSLLSNNSTPSTNQVEVELKNNDENNNLSHVNTSIYPNPTNGMVNIELPKSINENSLFEIKVFDILGKLLLTKSSTSGNSKQSIDLSQYNNGNYIIIISNSEGLVEKQLINLYSF